MWSTVSESDLEGIGRGGVGWLGLRGKDEEDEFEAETDLSDE